jgi:hypothetical protein
MKTDIDILLETEETLKQEKVERLVRQYTPYIIILAILIILGTAIFSTYDNFKSRKLAKISSLLIDANLAAENNDLINSQSILDKAISKTKESDIDIWNLVALSKIQNLISENNISEAVKWCDKIIHHAKPSSLKDLAYIIKSNIEKNSVDIEKLSWSKDYGSIIEAIASMDKGNMDDAQQKLLLLSSKADATQSTRNIADKLLAIIHNRKTK